VENEKLSSNLAGSEKSMPFALAECLLNQLKVSGASEQEALAALKAAEAMLPLLQLKSEKRLFFRS
jgi:hypothetical protein